MRGKTFEILKKAMEGKFAVGAFNTSNLELTQGIVRAAHELKKPCIVQITTSAMEYAGCKVLGDVVNAVGENESNSTVIGFHLDHGKSIDDIIRGVDAGVDSVMIDGSQLNFKENVDITRRVVDFAHEKGIAVQAELGRVPYIGREDQEIDWDEVMSDPERVKELVEETGVDAMAIGIGNAHGFFRERSEPDWERLEKIKKMIPQTPLILHGASDWSKEKVRKAIELGVCCFNIDTDIRIAFITAMCNKTNPRCDTTDPRKILGEARKNVTRKVKEKIKMFSIPAK